jgi:hypothetical protein
MLAGCGAQVKLNVASEMNARAGQPVRFDAFTQEAAKSKYSWDFGDGSKAQGATLQHTYKSAGEYTAQLKLKGDGKRGAANIKVKVGPPSALSVIPKEAGFAVVVDNLAEAKAAWDIFHKMPFLTEAMDEAKGDMTEELGFFVLEESELSSRGFDASLGGAFGVMTVEDHFVPLMVGGIKSDGKALDWVKGFISKEGLSTKDEQIDGVTITHTYYRNREIGAMGTTANFLIYSPSVATSTDYHIQAIKAALNTAKTGAIFDNEWFYHSGISGGAAMYLEGGDFLVELSREMDSSRDLRQLASSLRTTAQSLHSISASVRTIGGNFETDLAFWMTEDGLKNYQALAPQVPLLNVAPSMASDAIFYLTGHIDPLEAAKQGVAGLSPSERADLNDLLSQAKSMLGFDLAEDFGKPMGAANAMLISIDVDGLIAALSGYDAMPVEFIWAYQLDDTERFKKSLSSLIQQASPFAMMGGFRIDTKQSGGADIYSANFGFLEVAWAVGPGMTILSVGSGPGTIEKALELITPAKGPAKADEEQKFVIQFDQLGQKLSEAQTQLQANGKATGDLATTIDALKSFQLLTGKVSTDGDTVRTKMTLELTK